MRELWLWGKGGYFTLLVGAGTEGIPQGEKAWRRFAAYAPDILIAQAIALLEAKVVGP